MRRSRNRESLEQISTYAPSEPVRGKVRYKPEIRNRQRGRGYLSEKGGRFDRNGYGSSGNYYTVYYGQPVYVMVDNAQWIGGTTSGCAKGALIPTTAALLGSATLYVINGTTTNIPTDSSGNPLPVCYGDTVVIRNATTGTPLMNDSGCLVAVGSFPTAGFTLNSIYGQASGTPFAAYLASGATFGSSEANAMKLQLGNKGYVTTSGTKVVINSSSSKAASIGFFLQQAPPEPMTPLVPVPGPGPNPNPVPVNPIPVPVNPMPNPYNPIPIPVNPMPTPVNPMPVPYNPIPVPYIPIPTPLPGPNPIPLVPPIPGPIPPTPVNPMPTPYNPIPVPYNPIPVPVNPIPTPYNPIPVPYNPIPIPTPVNPIPTPYNPIPTPLVPPGPGPIPYNPPLTPLVPAQPSPSFPKSAAIVAAISAILFFCFLVVSGASKSYRKLWLTMAFISFATVAGSLGYGEYKATR
jgi:hypothetical protein